MTFSSHVFPKTIFSIPYLVFFTFLLLIQFVGCFQLLSTTWDFAIVHGQQVTFSSLSSSGPKQVMSIPAPISSIYDHHWLPKNSNLNLNSSSISNNAGSERKLIKTVNPLWHKGQSFKKLELDVKRGLFFLTSYPWNLQSLVVFNITSNETYSLLINESSAPITGLVYHNGWLYWTNKASNAIWRMNTSNDINTWKPEAEPFYKSSSPECTLSELAIDAKTNKLFFINACQDEYKIQYYNGTHSGIVRVSNDELRALTTDASFLYWVDHPGDFSIQRVSLSNLNGMSQILYHGKTQFINSVSIVGCSQDENKSVTESLLWANCNSKAVIQRDDFSGSGHVKTQTRTFGRFCPRGLISRSFALKDWSCNKTLTTNVSSTVSNSPMEKVFPSMSLTTTEKATTTTEKATFTTEKSTTTTTAKTTTTTPKVSTTSSSTTTTSTAPSTTTTTLSSSSTSSSTTTTLPTTTSPRTNTTSPPKTLTTTTPVTTIATTTTTTTEKIQNVSSKLIPAILSVPQSDSLYYPSKRTGTLDIALIVTCSCLLVLVVILLIAVVFLYRKVRKLQQKPRIRRRVIVSRSRDNNVPSSSMCELIDIENCCNMNECETPCYERLGSASSNSNIHQDYKSEGKARTEDKERLID